MELETQLSLFIVLILLALSAILAGAEIAIVSASPAKLHKAKTEGDSRAKIALKLHNNREKVFGCILLLYNLVTIAASTLTTTVVIDIFGDSAQVITAITIVMTAIIVIYGELMPKTFAVRESEKVSLVLASTFNFLTNFLSPVIQMMNWIVDKSFWLLRVNMNTDKRPSGLETIRGTIEFHHDEGEVVSEDKYMLGGIIDLSEIDVDEAMIHRNEIKSISLDDPAPKIINDIIKSIHSRLPIWQTEPDNILGIIHVKDVLKILTKKRPTEISHKDIMNIARDPWFIPNTTTLKKQLEEFRKKHTHFAIVVDEYGDLDGIITLEDILEEVVGQIDDEYDEVSERKFRKHKDGSVVVAGDLSIRDLNRYMHWDLTDSNPSTVGGLLLHLAKEIPPLGKSYKSSNYKLTLFARHGTKLTKIKVKHLREKV